MAAEGQHFAVEVSPSNRAQCKFPKCLHAANGGDKKIAKGELRFTKQFTAAVLGDVAMAQHFHLDCALVGMMPHARKWAFASGAEIDGYAALSAEDKAKVDELCAEGVRVMHAAAAEKEKAKVRGGKGRKAKADDTVPAHEAEVEKADPLPAAPKPKRARKAKADAAEGAHEAEVEIVVAQAGAGADEKAVAAPAAKGARKGAGSKRKAPVADVIDVD